MVDQVTIVGTKDAQLQRVNIKVRYNRNPVIGDKFSSRHGQKGVLSQQWKDTDMPFCEASGMRCDDVFPRSPRLREWPRPCVQTSPPPHPTHPPVHIAKIVVKVLVTAAFHVQLLYLQYLCASKAKVHVL